LIISYKLKRKKIMKNIKYQKRDIAFKITLFARVNRYFSENNLKKTGNKMLFWKSSLLLSAYISIYLLLLISTNIILLYTCYIALGMLTIFVALNIGHDAAHHTFSANRKYNNLLLYTFDFLGASGSMWRLKHVHSHHPHVNIPDMDGDIKQSNLVRIFPNTPFLSFHRYQYLYMPILYLFYTLNWLLFRDFKDYLETNISGKPGLQHQPKEYLKLITGKVFYFSRMLLFPFMLLPFLFGTILWGVLLFHFAASATVAMALVSAHIGENSVYPEPDAEGNMPTSWIKHQILTTCDFATENRIITHLFGGFNHHLVHHIFPNICHIHYPKLTEILIKTCKEFKMPYQSNPTLISAVFSHLNFLKIRSLQGKQVEYLEI